MPWATKCSGRVRRWEKLLQATSPILIGHCWIQRCSPGVSGLACGSASAWNIWWSNHLHAVAVGVAVRLARAAGPQGAQQAGRCRAYQLKITIVHCTAVRSCVYWERRVRIRPSGSMPMNTAAG